MRWRNNGFGDEKSRFKKNLKAGVSHPASGPGANRGVALTFLPGNVLREKLFYVYSDRSGRFWRKKLRTWSSYSFRSGPDTASAWLWGRITRRFGCGASR